MNTPGRVHPRLCGVIQDYVVKPIFCGDNFIPSSLALEFQRRRICLSAFLSVLCVIFYAVGHGSPRDRVENIKRFAYPGYI